MHSETHTHTHTHTHAHKHTRTHTHAHAQTHTQAHAHKYARTHTHTQTHTNTHLPHHPFVLGKQISGIKQRNSFGIYVFLPFKLVGHLERVNTRCVDTLESLELPGDYDGRR